MTKTFDSTVRTIVLVHGGFVDGSGWEEVYKLLKKDGYNVSIVQNPTISLADDVAVTKRILARKPVRRSRWPLLRRSRDHGSRQRSKGRRACLYHRLCPGQGRVGILADQESAAGRSRAADTAAAGRLPVPRQSQVPRLIRGRRGPKRPRSWPTLKSPGASKRSAARSVGGMENQAELVFGRDRGQDDSTSGPAFMSKRAGSTVVEVAGSHAIYVSQPNAVATLIKRAANEANKEAVPRPWQRERRHPGHAPMSVIEYRLFIEGRMLMKLS